MNFNQDEILVLEIFIKHNPSTGVTLSFGTINSSLPKLGTRKVGEAINSLVQKGLIEIPSSLSIRLTKKGEMYITMESKDTNNITFSLEEKRAARFALLNEIYKQSDGSSIKFVDVWEAGDSCKLPRKLTSLTYRYLLDEGLINSRTIQGSVTITHHAIKEIESATLSPNEPSSYFPPVNSVKTVIESLTIQNSNVQLGTISSNQTITQNSNSQEILSFLREILDNIENLGLKSEEKEELNQTIETIQSLLMTKKPNKKFLEESFFSIRNILEGIAGSTISSSLILMFPKVMSLIPKLY